MERENRGPVGRISEPSHAIAAHRHVAISYLQPPIYNLPRQESRERHDRVDHGRHRRYSGRRLREEG